MNGIGHVALAGPPPVANRPERTQLAGEPR